MKKLYGFIGALMFSVAAFGATFNLFTPATGVLKGNASTYVTTAAVNSDIYSLWTGTCNSSSYLRGDGVCATPPGTGGGTVNSVDFSAPSVFSVTGNPITTTGTIALGFATGQTANQVLATPNGSTGAVSLRSLVAADVAAAGSTTQVQFNSSGAFAGSSSFTWNGGSNLLNIGSSSVPGTYSVGSLGAMTISGVALSVPSFASNSNIQGNLELHSYTSATPAAGSLMYGVRARGTSASPTAVASGDNLLTIGGAGYDGTNYTWGAHIHFLADGTPSAGVLPGALDFQTTPSGSDTPASVLLLDHVGSYAVNGSHGTSGNVLVSAGAGATTWGTVNLASSNAVTGTAAVTNGGTGVATLTGIAKGNGTSAFTAAVSGDVIATWGGTCSASTYLRGDGSCQTPPTGGTSANPSATIGLTAVNGSAGTFLRSDGAPALSQAIAPTWTGNHTFTPASGVSIVVNGAANNFSQQITGNSTTSQSYGLRIDAGTNSVDQPLLIRNQAASSNLLSMDGTGRTLFTSNSTGANGDGGLGIAATIPAISLRATGSASDNRTWVDYVSGTTKHLATINDANTVIEDWATVTRSGTAVTDIKFLTNGGNVRFQFGSAGQFGIGGANYGTAGQVLTSGGSGAAPSWGTLVENGTFTATLSTGCGTTPTATFKYARTGNIATVTTAALSCTSTGATLAISGLPAAVQPTSLHDLPLIRVIDSGTSDLIGCVYVSGSALNFGLRTAGNSCSVGGFTGSGTKGVSGSMTYVWSLD